MAEEKVKSLLHDRWRDAESAREPYEGQWRINLAWLVGRQYTVWHKAQKRIIEKAVPEWRVRLVANRILPIWRSSIGRMLKTRPIPDAIPASGDEQDVMTAKVGDKLLKHIWENSDMAGRKSIELYSWMLSCGTAFLQVWWDHEQGELIEDPESVDDLELLENPEAAYQRMGDIALNVLSPFEVFPDNSATGSDDALWLWNAKALPVDVLKERFPEHKSKISPESGLEMVLWPFDQSYTSPTGQINAGPHNLKEHARLKEYYEKPSSKYIKGRHAIMIGDTIIDYQEKLPYDHGQLPVIKFDYIYYPGRYWGGAVIEQLIPIQREYNRTRSQIIENKNMLSKPKLLVPSTAEIPADAWTTEPGERVTYNPFGGKPEPWVPPPIPGYVLQELDRNEQDMMEVSSHHWAARGMNPPGVRTAAGLAMLQEADDTPFGPVLQWNENSWRTAAKQCLELGKQFYTEPRTVYLGLGNTAEVAEFSREKLQGRFRIRVDVGSTLPMSRAARMQFALEMLDRGAFRNDKGQVDEPRFFQFLEMETALDIYRDDAIDLRVARTENVEMRDRLTSFEPGEYDNHPAHMDEHIRFMKELALEHGADHEAVAMFGAHIKAHELRMREAQLKRVSEQIAIQQGANDLRAAAGIPPQPPPGGPPPSPPGPAAPAPPPGGPPNAPPGPPEQPQPGMAQPPDMGGAPPGPLGPTQ